MTDNLPPRDRRQKRRILTLRNVGLAALVVFIAFGAFSLWRELNPRSDDGTALLETRKQKVEELVVREETPYVDTGVDEHDPGEPLWTERPSQEQILGVDPYDQYRQNDAIELSGDDVDLSTASTGSDPEPALSRGGDEPFLEQRSDRETSRVKITGSGTDLKIEKPDGPGNDQR